jgi:uncharacterized membrane protein
MTQIPDAQRPLSPEEISDLRSILEKEKRMVWVWSTFRVWAGWVAAVVGAYFAAKAFLLDVVAKIPK